jgi:hypothetical protein
MRHKRLSIDTTYKYSCALSVSLVKAPLVINVTPFWGAIAGGTTLQLDGRRFGDVLDCVTVQIGGQSCTDVVLLSPTQIMCKTPALSAQLQAELGDPGRLSRDVVVTTSAGSGECEMQFTYSRGV